MDNTLVSCSEECEFEPASVAKHWVNKKPRSHKYRFSFYKRIHETKNRHRLRFTLAFVKKKHEKDKKWIYSDRGISLMVINRYD